MGKRNEILNENDFKDSGPKHLAANTIDWNKPEHECSVMACLVQATYVLENDRKKGQILASEWWTSFGFEQIKIFTDNNDGSIVGAIYRNTRYDDQAPKGPRFVIAFRGTILAAANVYDLFLDWLIGDGGLASSLRWKEALQSIDNHISEYGVEGTFLAGHSLGASMAFLAGAHMAFKGVYLKTFLFNLPASLTQEQMSKRLIARFLQTAPWLMLPLNVFLGAGAILSLFTGNALVIGYSIFLLSSLAGVAGASVLSKKMNAIQGEKLQFAPYLFVNPEDIFCKEWITYFHKKSKEENKRSKLQIASFVESGVLKINLTPGQGKFIAHALNQWWQQNLNLLSLEEYRSHGVIVPIF